MTATTSSPASGDCDVVRDPVGDEARPGEPLEIGGEVPTPVDIQPGCRFANRCPFAFDRCRVETPVLHPHGGETDVACHLYD